MSITDKNKSTLERLKELSVLYEAGALTEEEMEAEKAEILDGKNVDSKDKKQANVPNENFSECNLVDDEFTQTTNIVKSASNDKNGQEQVKTVYDKTNTAKGLSRKIIIGIAIAAIILIVILISVGTSDGMKSSGEVAPIDTVMPDDNLTSAVDSGYYDSEIFRAIDGASATTTTVADFFAIPEVANDVQNEYGIDYYKFLKDVVSSCNNLYLDIEKNLGGDGFVKTYTFSTPLDSDKHWLLRGIYDVLTDNLQLLLSSNGNVVNHDGTFALYEGSKWKLAYEKDEFGDPIQEKAFVYVEGETDDFSSHLQIAIPMNDENQVVFYYELPISDVYDHHSLSIKVKNKTDDSMYEIKSGECFRNHYVLTKKDSRYIRNLCDSDPSGSFSIRFDITDYDYFGSDKSYIIMDFNNGRAYGISNAIAHYFNRAFTVNK